MPLTTGSSLPIARETMRKSDDTTPAKDCPPINPTLHPEGNSPTIPKVEAWKIAIPTEKDDKNIKE